MNRHQIREVYSARPFQPFLVHLADGRRFEVQHPEFFSMKFDDRVIHIVSPDNRQHYLDRLMITGLEVIDEPS